jgi:hypothetical protein
MSVPDFSQVLLWSGICDAVGGYLYVLRGKKLGKQVLLLIFKFPVQKISFVGLVRFRYCFSFSKNVQYINCSSSVTGLWVMCEHVLQIIVYSIVVTVAAASVLVSWIIYYGQPEVQHSNT